MEGIFTLGTKVGHSAHMTLIGIRIRVGGEVSGLMNTRAPLMDGRV